MSSQEITNHREQAEIYHGEELCKQKCHDLLDEISLPKGLLPLNDIVEVGYNRTTGFMWLKQKRKKEHRFRSIGQNVSYGDEITAFLEDRRMRKITGVKTKEFLIWFTISDIYIDDPSSGVITFATPAGISSSLPASAFEDEGNSGKSELN